jgi:hypothetical protein
MPSASEGRFKRVYWDRVYEAGAQCKWKKATHRQRRRLKECGAGGQSCFIEFGYRH